MRMCVFPLSMHPPFQTSDPSTNTRDYFMFTDTEEEVSLWVTAVSEEITTAQHDEAFLSKVLRHNPKCFTCTASVYICMYVGYASLVFLTMAPLSSCVCPLSSFLLSPHSTLFLFFFFLLLHTCLYLLPPSLLPLPPHSLPPPSSSSFTPSSLFLLIHSLLPLPPHSPLFHPSSSSLPNPSHFLLPILPHSPSSLPSGWFSP